MPKALTNCEDNDALTPQADPKQPTSYTRSKGLRVDTIPWPVRPFYLAAGWTIGAMLYLYYLLCRLTSQITVQGPGNRDLSQHCIYCIWHESWWSYFIVFPRLSACHAMISHPAAYMKPLHCVFQLMGLKRLFLGSSGEEGRQAINKLARLIKKGWSTTISPDGPAGPPRHLKKGILHLASQSGVPIVPLAISAARFISVSSWDGKKHPLPFNQITLVVHEPIHVDQKNFGESAKQIVNALGGPQ